MRIIHLLYMALLRWWVVMLLLLLPCAVQGITNPVESGGDLRKEAVPDSVMRHVLASALVYSDKVSAYKAELYLKGHFSILKQNKLVRFIPSMFRFEKGISNYVHESVSELHYTAPSIYDRKIKAVQSTFPNANGAQFDIIDYMKFNFYASSVMENRILSPFNANASIHYRYRMDSVVHQRGGDLYAIRVIPRYRSTQLMEGTFWITSADWTVRYFDVRGKYGLIGFHLCMRMGEEEEARCLPSLIRLEMDFKFMGNHLRMNYTGWMKYEEVVFKQGGKWAEKPARSHQYNLSNSYVLTCDTSHLVTDRDSFSQLRPLPLTPGEDSLYLAFEERREIRQTNPAPARKGRLNRNMVFLGQVGDALISSYNIDFSKLGSVRCSPLINPLLVSYSHRNGVSYRQEFKYNNVYHDGRLLRITPQVGYNFTKRELYAKADMEYVYNPRRNGMFELQVGNGNRIYSSVVLDKLKEIPDSTFSFDGLELDYFKDVYLNVAHSFEPLNGLTFRTGVSIHRRYMQSTREVEERVRSTYNSIAPRIRVEWTPGMYYYFNNGRKVNLGSHYPTFTIDYERGFKWLKNSGRYERVEVSAEQSIMVRDVCSLAYHVGGGMFTNQEELYFVDYVDFANLNLPQGWKDDIGGTFQLLDSRWYNASRHYFRGNFTYEAPFLLLYPVSRLLSFIQKERLYGGILFMPHLNPYIELGYGFATHVFDVGIFVSNEKGKFSSVGCKFTFELFNK